MPKSMLRRYDKYRLSGVPGLNYDTFHEEVTPMIHSVFNVLSIVCLVFGFVSIFASIAIWFAKKGDAPETRAYAERFGIFVGLWVPAFFALAIYFRMVAAG
jgi:maltodextrin utilization protein YvdJ